MLATVGSAANMYLFPGAAPELKAVDQAMVSEFDDEVTLVPRLLWQGWDAPGNTLGIGFGGGSRTVVKTPRDVTDPVDAGDVVVVGIGR